MLTSGRVLVELLLRLQHQGRARRCWLCSICKQDAARLGTSYLVMLTENNKSSKRWLTAGANLADTYHKSEYDNAFLTVYTERPQTEPIIKHFISLGTS